MICVRDTTREIKGSKREKEKEKGKEYLIDTFLKHKVEESLAIAFCFLCVFTKGNHCFHPLSCVGGGGGGVQKKELRINHVTAKHSTLC